MVYFKVNYNFPRFLRVGVQLRGVQLLILLVPIELVIFPLDPNMGDIHFLLQTRFNSSVLVKKYLLRVKREKCLKLRTFAV